MKARAPRVRKPIVINLRGRPWNPDLSAPSVAQGVFVAMIGTFLMNAVAGLATSLDLLDWQSTVLDIVPRHDEDLDDKDYAQICSHTDGKNASPILSDLEPSQSDFKKAVALIRKVEAGLEGLLRGQLKDHIGEPLSRLALVAESLCGKVQQLQDKHRVMPRKPYEIRQAYLTVLCRDWQKASNELLDISQGMRGAALDPGLLSALQTEQDNFLSLRARFCKLRDNPSQKIGEAVRAGRQEFADFETRLLALCGKG